MSYDCITHTIADGVARITFNRPDQLNALNSVLLTEMQEALESAAANDEVRTVLLAAHGRAFSSGADLKEGSENSETGVIDTGVVLRTYYHPLIETMRGLEKPIVAAVQGLAAGAGCSVALAADMVIAAESAAFQQIFTNISLVPDAGSSYFLPRLVGDTRALGAVLTGEVIDAERAERWGLIWQVVPDAELEQCATDLATRLAQRPTRALGMAKRLLAATHDHTLSEQLEREAQTQVQAQETEDFMEAVQAFLQKRAPDFKGR